MGGGSAGSGPLSRVPRHKVRQGITGNGGVVVKNPETSGQLAAADRTAQLARTGMSAFTGTLGAFAMFVSLMPTNYDPEMPDYSDPDMVAVATAASGSATLLTLTAMAFVWRSTSAFVFFSLLLAVDLYRFTTLVTH